ncbi:MAG: tetratricopeptide repeat protein [Phycisphaerae bacterium]|nr:tetratricopeptide repeat protein [Phycisphaerae bacterium]
MTRNAEKPGRPSGPREPQSTQARVASTAAPTASAAPRPWLIPVAVAVLTFLAFIPSLSNGWVNWDDDKNFLENENYRGLGPKNLAWMFTTFHLGPYQPLAWLTLGADYVLWGMRPGGYHMTNILFHAATAACFALLLARLLSGAWLRRATSGDPAMSAVPSNSTPTEPGWSTSLLAGAAALFWAVHPLRVEAVTWITERREVVCGVLSLTSLLLCLADRRRAAALVAITAMLAKGVAVVLPGLFILLELYRRRAAGAGESRVTLARALVRQWPAIGAAALFSIVAFWGQHATKATVTTRTLTPVDRLVLCGNSLGFYVRETLWPGPQPVIREIRLVGEAPERGDVSNLRRPAIVSAVLLAALLIACIAWRRRVPAVWMLLVAYLAMVLPVSGLFQVGLQYAADRYAYQSGWVVTLALLLVLRAAARRLLGGDRAPHVAAAILLVALCARVPKTIAQQRIWRDTKTLWSHQIAVMPEVSSGYYNLAHAYSDENDLARAIPTYQTAIDVRPGFVAARFNIADCYNRAGRPADAEKAFREVMRLDPDLVPVYVNFAELLVRQGRIDEALELYAKAQALKPSDPEMLSNIASAYMEAGRYAQSAEKLREAIRLSAGNPDFHYNLGNALQKLDQPKEAEAAYREAIRLRPDHAESHNNLGNLLSAQGRVLEAIASFEAALRLNPGYVVARYNLALEFARRGDDVSAIRLFGEVVQQQPELAPARLGLARALSRQGRVDEAVRQYREYLKRSPDDAETENELRELENRTE